LKWLLLLALAFSPLFLIHGRSGVIGQTAEPPNTAGRELSPANTRPDEKKKITEPSNAGFVLPAPRRPWDPDLFTGSYRRVARTTPSKAPIEQIETIKKLLSTLSLDGGAMRAKVIDATERTSEEDRNLMVTGYLYAVKKEDSNDYVMVIGDEIDEANAKTPMICRVSGIPPRETPDRETLLKVRQDFKKQLGTYVPEETGKYRVFEQARRISVTGSLYFNGFHEVGKLGPDGLETPTVWEIQPVTSFQILDGS
jgi:hypothetical protein